MTAPPRTFQGSIPEHYDRYLRPLLFEPYARDAAARLDVAPAMRVLEIACGTGVVTRALLGALPGDATLVATDLSEQMLAVAEKQVSTDLRLAWQSADATTLPFNDRSFDTVVCQFGIMFFPDKERALREMRRVLRAGGRLLFSTWDALERNDVTRLAHEALARAFPARPPRFFTIPFGMHDAVEIRRLVEAANFREVEVRPVSADGHSPSARDAATGLVKGTPVSGELLEQGASLEDAVEHVAGALSAAYGEGELRATMSALITTARA